MDLTLKPNHPGGLYRKTVGRGTKQEKQLIFQAGVVTKVNQKQAKELERFIGLNLFPCQFDENGKLRLLYNEDDQPEQEAVESQPETEEAEDVQAEPVEEATDEPNV